MKVRRKSLGGSVRFLGEFFHNERRTDMIELSILVLILLIIGLFLAGMVTMVMLAANAVGV